MSKCNNAPIACASICLLSKGFVAVQSTEQVAH